MKRPTPEEVAEAALSGGGYIPVRSWMAWMLGESEIVALCRRFDLKPRGGFRIEKAPVGSLLDLLDKAFLERDDVRRATVEILCEHMRVEDGGRVAVAAGDGEAAALLVLKTQENEALRGDLEKARKTAEKQRGRTQELEQRLEKREEDLTRSLVESTTLRRALEERDAELRPAVAGEDAKRIEAMRRQQEQTEQALDHERRRTAELVARVSELEQEVEELRAKVPDWKTKKRDAVAPPELPQGELLIPRFTEEFYRSLVDRDRRVIRSAFETILTLCLHGPSYPSLETKSLHGAGGLWSIRAGLKHRVYFTAPKDGEFLVVGLEDREEQHTFLRRKKDR